MEIPDYFFGDCTEEELSVLIRRLLGLSDLEKDTKIEALKEHLKAREDDVQTLERERELMRQKISPHSESDYIVLRDDRDNWRRKYDELVSSYNWEVTKLVEWAWKNSTHLSAPDVMLRAREYLLQQRKIDAIKVLRQVYPIGLRDAKDIIEGTLLRRD